MLLNFYCFWGSHPLRGWQMGGWGLGWVWVCVRVSYAHTHACMCTHTCMHIHVKHGCLHVGGHLQFLYMNTCACIHVHVYMCMWGHPHAPRCPPHPPPTCPLPSAAGRPKHQNSISPELIKIIQFCLKILYL